MSADEDRRALRPKLDLVPAAATEEKFQNETLRPIMKLQHDLILAIFRHFLLKRKVKLEQFPADQRFGKIKEMVARDHRLRELLFGLAMGQCTAAEMTDCLEHESDVHRRMTNLVVERLTSVFAPVTK